MQMEQSVKQRTNALALVNYWRLPEDSSELLRLIRQADEFAR
jgi:hypothetical protein